MNKAHSSSSAEYIRNQQNFPHDIAIILYSVLPGDIYIASTFHGWGVEGGIRQIPTDSANGSTEFMGVLASETQEAPHATCRTTSFYTWESRPCRTWSSPGLVKTRLSGQDLQNDKIMGHRVARGATE